MTVSCLGKWVLLIILWSFLYVNCSSNESLLKGFIIKLEIQFVETNQTIKTESILKNENSLYNK